MQMDNYASTSKNKTTPAMVAGHGEPSMKHISVSLLDLSLILSLTMALKKWYNIYYDIADIAYMWNLIWYDLAL